MPGRLPKNRVSSQALGLLSGLCFAVMRAAQPMADSDASSRPGAQLLRLAVSEKVVRGVNVNDARAAVGVWTTELLKDINLNLVMAPDQSWVMPSEQLQEAIRTGKVDVFCLTVYEYRRVAPYVDTTRIITDNYGGEELLLVVREGSGIANLAGLRGRSLILQESPGTSLAEPWLTVSLWQDGLESPEQMLGHMTTNAKLSQVVLPVFFGQADACVVTRRGLNTMCELNPQLSRRLKILLSSPQMEGAFFAWRKGYPAYLKKPVFDRLLNLRSSPAAQQVVTLFQSPGFTARSADCLATANALLDVYERHHEPATARKR